MTLAEYFATGPPHERPVFDQVVQCLAGSGPLYVEAVAVGIFLKNPHKVAELRPMQRWVAVYFTLDRRARHRTISRKVLGGPGGYFHVANVAAPSDVDGDLCALLREAYDRAG